MTLFVALLTASLLVFVLILAAPVRFTFVVNTQEKPRVRAKFRAVYGLVQTDLRGDKERQRAKRPSKRRRREGKRRPIAALSSEGFILCLRRFLTRLWRAIHWSDVCLEVKLGLDDPADTGELWGFVGPAAAAGAATGHDIRVTPCFEGATLEVVGRATVGVVPLTLLVITTRFALSPTSLKAWRAMRSPA